jgi:CRISPR-associated protein Cas5h
MNYHYLNVSADFARFSKSQGTAVKQSYKTPPKTTIQGMLAAILGKERDSYYSEFADANFEVGIVKKNGHSKTMTFSLLGTGDNLKSFGNYGSDLYTTKIKTPVNTRDNRQRYPIEYIIEPEYDIYFRLSDSELNDEITRALSNRESVYTPTLGVSEAITTIEYKTVDSHETVKSKEIAVDSVVPELKTVDIVIESNKSYKTEKQQQRLSRKNETKGRQLEDVIIITSTEKDDKKIKVSYDKIKSANGQNIIFF